MVRRLLVWVAPWSGVAAGALGCMIALRVATVPENHMGWSPLWGELLLVPACILNGSLWWLTRRRWAAIVALAFAISSVALVLLDQCDVLMSYEAWLARGMPPRPF